MKERTPIEPPRLVPPNGRRGRAGSFIRQKKGPAEIKVGIVPFPEGFSDPSINKKNKRAALERLTALPTAAVEEKTPDELEGPEEKLTRFAREDAQLVEHQAYNDRLQKLRDRREGFIAIVDNPNLPTSVKQQARIEAAKLKKQIELLLPKNEVREARAQSQAALLRRLEEKRLELLRREADPTVFYALRYEATNELRILEKKIAALKELQRSVKASYGIPGEVIPTAKGVRKQILDTERLQNKTSVPRSKPEQQTERVSSIQDLYGYYMEALRLALDPVASSTQKQRAKADLFYHALKTQRAVELLPTATARQRERKALLEQEIQPFVFKVDEQFDWTNPRLLPVYGALRACYHAQRALSQERTPDRIQDFKKSVQELESIFETLKRSLGSRDPGDDEAILHELTPEDLVLRDAFLLNGKIATPPASPYQFKTLPADTTTPFNQIPPLPPEPNNVLKNIARYEDLVALQGEDSAAADYGERVKRTERHLTSLENMIALFRAQATRESDNLLYLRQPQAIGARADYSLDDIERLRRLKETDVPPTPVIATTETSSPFASLKLRSEAELRQEGIAFRRMQLETEIHTLETTLRTRLGGKLPRESSKESTPLQSVRDLGVRLWNGAKDLWNKVFTKNYISNEELSTQYEQKQLALKKFDAATQDPTKEINASRKLKQAQEHEQDCVRALSDRDSSHEQKIEAIRSHYKRQAFLNAYKPNSIADEQRVVAVTQDLKRTKQLISEYQQKLKRLSLELVGEIVRQKHLTSVEDPERLRLLLSAQRTTATRELHAYMAAQQQNDRLIAEPTDKQIHSLTEAHELEYELANNRLTTQERIKRENKIKECYQIAYGQPSSRWAFWRRAA